MTDIQEEQTLELDLSFANPYPQISQEDVNFWDSKISSETAGEPTVRRALAQIFPRIDPLYWEQALDGALALVRGFGSREYSAERLQDIFGAFADASNRFTTIGEDASRQRNAFLTYITEGIETRLANLRIVESRQVTQWVSPIPQQWVEYYGRQIPFEEGTASCMRYAYEILGSIPPSLRGAAFSTLSLSLIRGGVPQELVQEFVGNNSIAGGARLTTELRALTNPGPFSYFIQHSRVAPTEQLQYPWSSQRNWSFNLTHAVISRDRLNRVFGLPWSTIPEIYQSAIRPTLLDQDDREVQLEMIAVLRVLSERDLTNSTIMDGLRQVEQEEDNPRLKSLLSSAQTQLLTILLTLSLTDGNDEQIGAQTFARTTDREWQVSEEILIGPDSGVGAAQLKRVLQQLDERKHTIMQVLDCGSDPRYATDADGNPIPMRNVRVVSFVERSLE